MKHWLLMCVTMTLSAVAWCQPQEAIPLYPGEIPNSIAAPDEEAVRDLNEAYLFLNKVSRPTLTPYLPRERDPHRAAIIILPGGGYRGVSIVKEGHDVARAFNEMGLSAFVLKYRTPSPVHMRDRALGPLQDVQQALRLVRERAREWDIDPKRVAVIGFSAGGHLAAMAATRFDKPVLGEWRTANLRPDLVMLIYPVISFADEIAHKGSRQMLLGDAPDAAAIREFSNELQVRPDTPAAFIAHAADDASVPVGNSIRFFEALQAQKISAELIVYPAGGHGFGLNNSTTPDRWIERCRQWLQSQGWLNRDGVVHAK